MELTLPTPIAAYFGADNRDGAAVADCFAEYAEVKDEGQSHVGKDAIQAWADNASKQYSFTSEPFACQEKDGAFVVSSKVSGTFPGSPVDLAYTFRIEGDKVAYLEIAA